MAIPDYQTLMRPLLQACADGAVHRVRAIIDSLAAEFELSAEERSQLLPSGTDTTFGNRVGWARTYLKKAGMLEQPSRGVVRITERGRNALNSNVPVNNSYLQRFAEFNAWQRKDSEPDKVQTDPTALSNTPEETLQEAFDELRASLINEVHEALLHTSPAFFERAVIDLLRAMGYGGAVEDAGTLLGGPGDGGVDGAIKEDKLGLDTVYVQAKKWAAERTVGDAEIRNFIGALQLHRARKGVFFTTSDFSKTARASAARSESRVVLIDGRELATLMVEHNVGVNVTSTLQLKKLDSDYFED